MTVQRDPLNRQSGTQWYVAWKGRRELFETEDEARAVYRSDSSAVAMGRVRAEESDDA